MKALSGTQIANQAKEQLAALTGLPVDTVSALAKDEQSWLVAVEMVEMKCVPNGKDMLGCYQVRLDDDGTIINYKRTRRYSREDFMEEE
jgi:hypothetical protein